MKFLRDLALFCTMFSGGIWLIGSFVNKAAPMLDAILMA